MKILNLYACLGGNRLLWEDCEVTAVELDPDLVRMYQERFPNDRVICTDAHRYLLEHYKEYDFIWSSPPCPTHSRMRYNQAKGRGKNYEVKYPDLALYQQIIFLDNYFDGKYCVENVIPYYKPLIPGKKRGRHLYWTNFNLPNILTKRKIQIGSGTNEVKKLCQFHKIDLSGYKGTQRKDKIARNLVDYQAGKTILDTVRGIVTQENVKQGTLKL